MQIKQLNLFVTVFSCVFMVFRAAAFETYGKQIILYDMSTDTVLLEKNADMLMSPSSMSKIMTIYKVFEKLKDGDLSLNDKFKVSEKAWRKGGSKMFVKLNSRVKVEDLIRGVIVQSGNDATIVIAEGLSGTEGFFADELNKTAKELGMLNSHFTNASGWPDPNHQTTARDLTKLAISTIQDFPEFYHYYEEKTFSFNNIRQNNRNPALFKDLGADGLKTGYTKAGGYGVTVSAVKGDRRLVLVINGLKSKRLRTNETERVLDWGFRNFRNYKLFDAGETVADGAVWMGDEDKIPLITEKKIVMTLSRKQRRNMKVKVLLSTPIPAPVSKGLRLGSLQIDIPGRKPLIHPIVSAGSVAKLSFLSKLKVTVKYLLWGELK
ncbi:MAG: D-alanyl-D-alanine carboxypeptidase [Rhodospirillaceae bacterium]|nr:D-alanyl-D-alanine carboxypeptidase [Rhodospirillaceae bacterium]